MFKNNDINEKLESSSDDDEVSLLYDRMVELSDLRDNDESCRYYYIIVTCSSNVVHLFV
jgi:hypothetical protein